MAPARLIRLALAVVAVAWLSGARSGQAEQEKGSSTPAAGSARPPHLPRIDVHMHISPLGIDRLVTLMDRWGIDGAINLSGMYPGPPRGMLEMQLEAARRAGGRIAVFA